MARTKSSRGFLGALFGRKKKAPARKKTSLLRKVTYMLIALFTGGGSIAGASEYDWIRTVWNLLRERIHAPTAAPSGTSGVDGDTGAIRVYFTHPENPPEQAGDIAHAVVGYIDATEQTLDVAAFELDNRIITDALVRAVRRGVRVRCVTETNYIDESGIKALRSVGVTVIDDKRDGALMHNKFMVFDHKAVWTGSMNFTENCAYRNNNNGVYIPDAHLAENYATKFAWMFEQHKFGAAPNKTDRIPNPLLTLADGTQVENYFSTHDHPANHIVNTLKLAKKSIHFLAFSFTHEGISTAMLDKHAAGVEVSGVFEKTQTAAGHSAFFKMRDARLPVFLDGNPRNMHHKVIIIDSEILIVGSFNFSDSADKSNDENLLIIYNRGVCAKFEEEFQKVLKIAREANP
ncbi:MAG TPA: phospholipase D-like domain-containing protein [Gemmataceae bacterium]|jgi:phosphatidylserine/phosphatidylglycerophosphate/cardiolipin synthase-like enzyme|nr:phospholipase D-like domain-containing protein [Gemmataceae bacterium]